MCKENPSYYAIIPANVRYDKRLKANEKLLYGEITSLSNKNGYCWASNKYFADLYGVTNQAVSKWIKDLKDIGYIEINYIYKDNSKEIEKRIIKLIGINKSERVSIIDDDVLINDDTGVNKYLQGYKSEFKDNNTRLNNKINNINIYNDEFEKLWKKYPRKQGKSNALKAYIKARKSGVEYDTILNGIEKYSEYCQNIDSQYIKHGSTWFNQQCWDDDYSVVEKEKRGNYTFGGTRESKSTWGCTGESSYDIEELMKIK